MKTKIGSYLITQITGHTRLYIAEVVETDPLVLKVEERGPFARLKSGDYIIDETLSERIQDPKQETAVLQEAVERGIPLISGLASLGVKDEAMHDILPQENP